MKKSLVVIWFMVVVCSAQAQTYGAPFKFTEFFKANQPDSIYNLFTAKMKGAIKVEGTRQLLGQLKSQLGEITNIREMESKGNGLSEFRLSFERPIVEIALIIDKDSIAGLLQKVVITKKADSAQIDSPDNFTVDNSIGKLYGTLTRPKDKRKVPVVLMIGGSGPTDRDMNQGQALRTNSFLLLAKGLAENGIASLRYDKRGVGTSMEAVNKSSLTLDDFINDAKLFISKLALDHRFSSVIVLGHSEGAVIGLAASLQTKPTAYISVCGFENNMLNLIGEQLKPALTAEDFKIFSEVADSLKAGKIVTKKLPSALATIFTPTSQSFLISTLKYNPSIDIQRLKIPVLVIGGSTDLQVSAAAATQLAKMNKRSTLKIIPEMNHILKSAPADRMQNLATYNNPTLPLHDDIVPLLTNFIKKSSAL